MDTYDCEPTLDDRQVVEFCRTGHLMLEGIVPEVLNRQAMEWLAERNAAQRAARQPAGGMANELLQERWFVDGVVRAPQAAGAIRSLLGADYHEPEWITDFTAAGREPANQWHVDGGSDFSHRLQTLKWFYLPVGCAAEGGPTEFVTGSHHFFSQVRFMTHYDGMRGVWKAAAGPGSIYLTAYQLWHRRAVSTVDEERIMLTSSVHRTSAPSWDWRRTPGFDIESANYGLDEPRVGEQNRSSTDTARMFCWLAGYGEEFATRSGGGWPFPPYDGVRARFGMPATIDNR